MGGLVGGSLVFPIILSLGYAVALVVSEALGVDSPALPFGEAFGAVIFYFLPWGYLPYAGLAGLIGRDGYNQAV